MPISLCNTSIRMIITANIIKYSISNHLRLRRKYISFERNTPEFNRLPLQIIAANVTCDIIGEFLLCVKDNNHIMKKFRRISVIIISVCVLLAAGINVYLFSNSWGEGSREYRVEVSRAADFIDKNGEIPDIGQYKYITDIELLVSGCSEEELSGFVAADNTDFQLVSLPNQSEYAFAKITYSYTDVQSSYRTIIVIDIVLGTVIFIAAAALVYVGREIIAPFEKIKEMPYELAKGTLTGTLPQNKNKFFGNFTWGLDMLREVLESRRRAELELVKEKKTLVLSISHDIKTPLSTIKMSVRALQCGLYSSKQKQDEVLSNISKCADDISQRVSDIMDSARTDFLHIQVNDGMFYLSKLLNRIKEYYSEKMQINHVKFTISCCGNCLLSGDEDRAVEVLQNIIDNAFKYGDGWSIMIGVNEEEGCKLVSVTNSGNTLPQDELKHIFESFYRGSNSSSQKGNGLGLYICKEIMHKMNGDVFAEITGDEIKVTAVFPMA